MLMRKVMVGLHDSALKQEIFRRCDSFKDADSLRSSCSTFVAALHHAGKFMRERAAAGAVVTADNITAEDFNESEPLVAASRQPTHPTKYGYRDPPQSTSILTQRPGSATVAARDMSQTKRRPLREITGVERMASGTTSRRCVSQTGH